MNSKTLFSGWYLWLAAGIATIWVLPFLLTPILDGLLEFRNTFIPETPDTLLLVAEVALTLVFCNIVITVTQEVCGRAGLLTPFENQRMIDFSLRKVLFVALVGVLCVAAALGILYALNFRTITGIRSIDFSALARFGSGALLFSVIEELTFRIVVFSVFQRFLGARWAIIGSALVFAATHVASDGADVISFVNTVLAGVIFAMIYERHARLWMPIAWHFGWNFGSGMIDGTISGHYAPSFLSTNPNAIGILSGGIYGVEASVAATLVLCCVIAYFALSPREPDHWEPVAFDED